MRWLCDSASRDKCDGSKNVVDEEIEVQTDFEICSELQGGSSFGASVSHVINISDLRYGASAMQSTTL